MGVKKNRGTQKSLLRDTEKNSPPIKIQIVLLKKHRRFANWIAPIDVKKNNRIFFFFYNPKKTLFKQENLTKKTQREEAVFFFPPCE